MFGATFVSPGGSGEGNWSLWKKILLPGSTPSFDFTSIPATFDHLMFIAQLRSDAASAGEGANLTFNGSAAANYYSLRPSISHAGVLSTAEQLAATFMTAVTVTGNLAPARSFGVAIGYIPNYANITMSKVLRVYGFAHITTGTGAQIQRDGNGIWTINPPQAINRMTFVPTLGANWLIDSSISVYLG